MSFQNLANWREEFLYYADISDKTNFPFLVIGRNVILIYNSVVNCLMNDDYDYDYNSCSMYRKQG